MHLSITSQGKTTPVLAACVTVIALATVLSLLGGAAYGSAAAVVVPTGTPSSPVASSPVSVVSSVAGVLTRVTAPMDQRADFRILKAPNAMYFFNELSLTPFVPVLAFPDGTITPTIGHLAGVNQSVPSGASFVSEPSIVRVSSLTLVIFPETDATLTDPTTGQQTIVRSSFTPDGLALAARAAYEFPDLVRAWSAGRIRLDLHVVFASAPLNHVIISDWGEMTPDVSAVRDVAQRDGEWSSDRDLLMAIWPRPAPYRLLPVTGSNSAMARHAGASGDLLPSSAYRFLGLSFPSAAEIGGRPFVEISTDSSAESLHGSFPSELLLHEWLHTFTWIAASAGAPQIDLDHPTAKDGALTMLSMERSWADWYIQVLSTLCDALDSHLSPRSGQ